MALDDKGRDRAGPIAVIVLDGNINLEAAVRRVGGGTTELVVVTPRRYAEMNSKARQRLYPPR